MKTLKSVLPAILAVLFILPLISRSGEGTEWEEKRDLDSIDCRMQISIYREFYKINLYEDAIGPWRTLFNQCPSASEQMYVDGVNMFQEFIENTSEGPEKEALIDTLMLIYDQRMEYFGGEGNVLGRKGRDLLKYRSEDIEAVHNAYQMLKKSIEIEGKGSRDAVMVMFINASVALNKQGKIPDEQAIADYFMVTEILDQLVGRSSRWDRAKEMIDEIVIREGILTCEALNTYFDPKFEENKDEKEFLDKVITFYEATGCDRSNVYVAASEQLYEIDPGPESAHNLGILFIAKNNYEKAAQYLKEAVAGEGTDSEEKAEWYYELAVVSTAMENYCEAIEYAREAIDLKSDYGEAYVLLGDAFVGSRDNLGEDFEKRTAFWAAADKYSRAAAVDPEVADKANEKLSQYTSQYPHKEDIFFRDMQEGDTYRVGGCINETTTVRARP